MKAGTGRGPGRLRAVILLLAALDGVTAADGEAAGAVIIGWEAVDDISARQAEGREWLDAFVFADVGSGKADGVRGVGGYAGAAVCV